jgi:type III secretory pathway component EscV
MPGKQMAIDADLSAGLIDERTRASGANSAKTKARSSVPWMAPQKRCGLW